jgi:hypothetical protein
MSRRTPEILVGDIWEAIRQVERYIASLDRAGFLKDDKTVDAVARNLQIIGEASGCMPAEFTAAHPEIEWQKIVALRHRIVHDYSAWTGALSGIS